MKTRSENIANIYLPITLAVGLLLLMACDMREKTVVAEVAPETEAIPTTLEDDVRVMVGLVAMDQEELMLSQLALQRSTNTDVTELARMMETAHTKTLAELAKLAEGQQLSIPTTLNETAEGSKTELNKLSGKEFDLKYCEMMVEGHGRAIALMEGAAENATGSDLRGWAIRTVPELRKHLDHALACQKKCEAI